MVRSFGFIFCRTVQHYDKHLLDKFWFLMAFGIICKCPLKSSLFISELFIFEECLIILKKCLYERKSDLRKCFRGSKTFFFAKLPTMSLLYKARSVHTRNEIKLKDLIRIFPGIAVKLLLGCILHKRSVFLGEEIFVTLKID